MQTWEERTSSQGGPPCQLTKLHRLLQITSADDSQSSPVLFLTKINYKSPPWSNFYWKPTYLLLNTLSVTHTCVWHRYARVCTCYFNIPFFILIQGFLKTMKVDLCRLLAPGSDHFWVFLIWTQVSMLAEACLQVNTASAQALTGKIRKPYWASLCTSKTGKHRQIHLSKHTILRSLQCSGVFCFFFFLVKFGRLLSCT